MTAITADSPSAVTILDPEGKPEERPSFPTSHPDLRIVWIRPGEWSITHVPTGLRFPGHPCCRSHASAWVDRFDGSVLPSESWDLSRIRPAQDRPGSAAGVGWTPEQTAAVRDAYKAAGEPVACDEGHIDRADVEALVAWFQSRGADPIKVAFEERLVAGATWWCS